jgi:AraC-like DNA-binding protein
MLCSAFGLSRSALYRLFAPIGGISDYIRQRRLARARLALNASARGRGGIGKIARQFGFSGRVRQRGVISAVALGHRHAAFAVMCRG